MSPSTQLGALRLSKGKKKACVTSAGILRRMVPLDALPTFVSVSFARDYHPPTIPTVLFIFYSELVEGWCRSPEFLRYAQDRLTTDLRSSSHPGCEYRKGPKRGLIVKMVPKPGIEPGHP